MNVLPQTISTYLNGALQSTAKRMYQFLANGDWVKCYVAGLSLSENCRTLGTQPIYWNTPIREDIFDAGGNLLVSHIRTPKFASDQTSQNANLLDLVANEKILDSSGNLSSESDYTYDGNGNLVATSQWLNTEDQVSSSTTYSASGMPTIYTDALGTSTQATYDATGLYLQSLTRANGTSAEEITNYTYDDISGRISCVQNPNDISAGRSGTTYDYDTFGNLAGISYPDGGHVGYNYYNYVLPQHITSTATAFPNHNTVSTVLYDGFSRTIQNTLPNGATVETVYDSGGRVGSIYNPHTSTSSSTDGTTYFIYDAMGRITKKTYPGGTSIQKWTYSGNMITYTDEANNLWQRTTDVLGRLTQVVEPNLAKTYYTYDALGNLTCATQDGGRGVTFASCAAAAASWRSRIFIYDGLSRLVSSSNPETGTTRYTYDADGNVLTKTDARSVVTHYTYDALNRLLSKTYTNAPSGTMSSCYQYDTATNGVGHLGFEWTQSGTCSSSPSGNYQSLRTFGAYDAMGRVTSEQQCAAGYCTSPSVPSTPLANCTALTAAPGLQFCYDFAGNLLAYSSGLTAAAGGNYSQIFDAAGRLVSVSSSFTDTSHPQQLFYAQGYTPSNALSSWLLGANLYTARNYDNRLRVCSQLSAAGQTAAVAQCGQ